ncbi:Gfo/Idh/MocA family oxidoreductase [Candidatus Poribacteria bacterium]|jgi:predicted dehydrogenase|nr:Gfo/Idh/MocA family oxidoreductase [Candidatus Poribacteria bacterium]MBT5536460.1 Gfo/Idh/MocA family oxidoreductase [Candidatus Poribacteria bacterium]MBT7096707.1 Gfo/Idh/MocA family oxidoreductase [Candidatus Poribacteria bacterium]MBT7805995.1 Gfo/Idh/MocA family oxidoreductase [Candidatus Poribacteria bacterium]
MDVLDIAVIGTGGRAGAHFATIPKLTRHFRLTAVADLDIARARAVADAHGVSAFADPVEMLDTVKPHVILIAVPPEGHHVLVAQAAERGIHAVSETPMSFSLACAQRMLDDAERHGTLLEVSENVRRWPMERLKRRIVDSGALGDVTQIHCWYGSGMYHGISAIRNIAAAEATQVIGHAHNVRMAASRWFDPFTRRSAGEHPGTVTAPSGAAGDPSLVTWELGVTTFANGVTSTHQYPIGGVRGNHWETHLTAGEFVANDIYEVVDGERRRLDVETLYSDGSNGRGIDALRVETSAGEVLWENPHRSYPLADADDVARADVLLSVHAAATEGRDLDYGGIGGYRDMEMMIAARESTLAGNAAVPLPANGAPLYDEIQHAEYARRYGHDPLDLQTSEKWTQEAAIASEIVAGGS